MHVPRRLVSSVCALLLSAAAAGAQNPAPTAKPGLESGARRTLLAVFAHPDDESTVSPVLAKYPGRGVTVYLAIATDGRLGVTQHAGIAAGDSLAAVRWNRLKCAAEKLDIPALESHSAFED